MSLATTARSGRTLRQKIYRVAGVCNTSKRRHIARVQPILRFIAGCLVIISLTSIAPTITAVTWTRLTNGKNGIPADWPTRVVREDPDREGLLYAGTEFGMFISFDNGARWHPFQLNLPNVPVSDIKVHHKDLVVSTQGRAIWILDNLTPLHQLTSRCKSFRA